MSDQERQLLDSAMISLIESINSFNQKGFRNININWSELYLLYRLNIEGQLNISEISGLLKVPMFKASRITSRLEKKNYVKKKPFSKDRRTIHVVITAAGKKMQEKVMSHHYALLSEATKTLSKTDKEKLYSAPQLMQQVTENI